MVCQTCEVAGPTSPSLEAHAAWIAELHADRDATLKQLRFVNGNLENAALRWTQTAYIQPQTHPYDRFFYDPELGNYTVGRYLADLQKRYGGIDAVLIWPTYTNIGIDDRNQFDFFRTMPGGLSAVRRITDELKAAGVRVLWPYNPWDTGTRREPSWTGGPGAAFDSANNAETDSPGDAVSDARTLVRLLKQTGADGFNGDTLRSVSLPFWTAALAESYPLAFAPELGGTDTALNWTTTGWGYWSFGSRVPPVDRYKFITRGRWLTNACDRWAKNRTDNLQAAWFNGAGYETWENVWGTWNGIVPRDSEAIRRVATMLRALGGSAAILRSSEWVPHTPQVSQDGVYASLFPADARTKWPGLRNAWNLVNRAGKHVSGVVLTLTPVDAKSRFFDCYRGVEILARKRAAPGQLPRSLAELGGHAGRVQLSALAPGGERADAANAVDLELQIEAGGFGCVVETDGAAGIPLTKFLTQMRTITQTPLSAFSSTWTRLPQTMVPMGKTARVTAAPAGMVRVPVSHNWEFNVRGVEIEGGDDFGTDVQFPWEKEPMGRSVHGHRHTFAKLGPFYIDRHPVTNAKYSAYLAATRYAPADPVSWLRHWNGSATPPPAIADAPVVYVSLAEARAYCAWAGARLPHSWEWQYAAQGTDGRLYPWGNNKTAAGAMAMLHSGRTNPGPPRVGAHSPAGDSPFGVADLVGTVWQYTDEFRDEHTRAVLLRGGSNYRPEGSKWYFPNKPELNTHNKYFLFSDSYERAGTVGLRCLVDGED